MLVYDMRGYNKNETYENVLTCLPVLVFFHLYKNFKLDYSFIRFFQNVSLKMLCEKNFEKYSFKSFIFCKEAFI